MERRWCGHRRDHADLVAHAELGDELVDAVDLGGAVGAAGAADHDEPGVGPAQRGERADRDVEALERLDATDEEEHRAVAEVEVVERGARTVAWAGREEGVVDAGRHELDPAAVGAVEALELVGLGVAGREDRVGAADHLGLGARRGAPAPGRPSRP